MDLYFLNILNEYRNHKNFLNFKVSEFENYAINTYRYPIAPFLQIITTYQQSISDVNQYINQVQYFKNIISYLYHNLYNIQEQEIISIYFSLLVTSRIVYGNEEITLEQMRQVLNYASDKIEIQEIQKILRYNYTEFLILYHPNKKSEINMLLKKLEENPSVLTFNDLLQLK